MITESIDKKDKEIVFVYTTCKDREEARSIGMASINEHFAVCADMWPIESLYPWEGVIEDVDQYMLVLTTKKDLADNLIKFIENMHSYKIPMIIETPIMAVSDMYAFWASKILMNKKDFYSPEEKFLMDDKDGEDGYHPGKLK